MSGVTIRNAPQLTREASIAGWSATQAGGTAPDAQAAFAAVSAAGRMQRRFAALERKRPCSQGDKLPVEAFVQVS